jgi:hypothetical protein
MLFLDAGMDAVQIVWFDAKSEMKDEVVVAELQPGSDTRLRTHTGHTFKFQSGASHDLGYTVVVDQLVQNVFISSKSPHVLQQRGGSEYKFLVHNLLNLDIQLMIALPEEEDVDTMKVQKKRHTFHFTMLSPDERIVFNLPTGYALQIKSPLSTLVEALQEGVEVNVIENGIQTRDLLPVTDEVASSKFSGMIPKEGSNIACDTFVNHTHKSDNTSENVTKAIGSYTVEILNKKTEEIRLKLEKANSKKKNLGKIPPKSKAKIDAIENSILVIETRGKGTKFHTVERISLLQGMRVVLHDGKFAEILFGHVRNQPVHDPMDQVDEVHDKEKQVQVALDAREGYVVSESETSEAKKKIDFEPAIADDLARLQELDFEPAIADDLSRLQELETNLGF